MVVGDADQSIYAFRGASIRNILDFEDDFPDARTILLEQNYRSTQTILTAANAVISRNEGRKDKKLWSDAGDGERIVGLRRRRRARRGAVRRRRDQEARGRRRASGPPTSRCSTGPTRSPVCSRRRSSAPASPTAWSAASGSTSAARSATRWPTCGCWPTPPTRSRCAGSSTCPSAASATAPIACVQIYAEQERLTFWEALRRAEEAPGIATRSLTQMRGFVAMIEELQSMVDAGERADVVLETVLERSGYLKALEESTDPQDETRTENLAELVAVAREFSEDPVAGPSADPTDVDAGLRRAGARRLPRAGLAGGRHRPDPRRRGRRGHPDDAAHRQGPGVPGGVPHRPRGRDLPALPVARRPPRARGGAPAGVRRPHPRPRAALRLPGAGPLGLGRAVPQPGVPVPRRAARRPRRLAAHRGRADRVGAARLEQRRRLLVTAPDAGHPDGRRPPQLLRGRGPGRRRSARPRPPGRSRRWPRATGSPTTPSGSAPWSRPRARARRPSRRSTSAARASSGCCCATRRSRSCKSRQVRRDRAAASRRRGRPGRRRRGGPRRAGASRSRGRWSRRCR